MWSRVASTAVLFVLAACSRDPLEPGAGNDPGRRTGTIVVGGSVVARPVRANARLPADLTSELQVVVTGGSGFVDTGSVTVTSATGTFPLTFVLDRGLGYWIGSAPSYDEVYVLDVMTDEGTLEGARVDGPDIHVFSQPEEGATVEAAAGLKVVWERHDVADTATMEIDSTLLQYLRDTGETSIAPETLAIVNASGLQHTLRVQRTNSVMLGSGPSQGPVWSASVVNAIDVITPPPP